MKPCFEYLELMNAVLDGEATPVQHEALSAHLAQCPACAALYEDLKALRAGSDALLVKAPETLKANVMSRIAAEATAGNVVSFSSKVKKKSANRWRSWAAMAAAFALVIGIGTSQNLFSGSSTASMPAPSAAPAAAEPSAAAEQIQDHSRITEHKSATGTDILADIQQNDSSSETRFKLETQSMGQEPEYTANAPAEAAPSVGPAAPSAAPLDIDWLKPAEMVIQRICGESGYTLETEYVTWLSSSSPYCVFRLLDGEIVVDEGTVTYTGLSENGKFHCFAWSWDAQTEEDALLFRYAVPLDHSYVMWAGETPDLENYDSALKN